MKQENYSSHCAGDQQVLRKKSAVLAISLGLLMGSLTAMQNVWAGCDIVTDGLVACYPFDGNANDYSGYGNHGTVNGGVTLTTDRFGKQNSAYNFDGTKGSIVIPSSLSLNPVNQLSIAFWIKNNATVHNWSPIIHKGGSEIWGERFNNREYTVWFMWNGIEVNSAGDNSTQLYLQSNAIPKAEWLHYVAVIDRQNHVIKSYINGSLSAEQTDPYSSFNNNDYDLVFGGIGETSCGSSCNYSYLNGTLDDVRIYNQALTEDEIKKLYEPPLSAKCDDPAKRARYSYKTGRVDISFTDVPLLEETSPNATGDTAVFKGLRLRLNANQDFEIVDPSAKPDDTGEPVGDPCHAVYTYENRTLKIPAVEVPTVLATFPTIKEGKPISVYEVLLQHVQVTPADLGFLHLQEAQLIEVIE